MGGIVSMFKKFANNDEGVSAVIGVILMVAITVILAAVIAALVFGMVGGTKKGYTVAATAQRTGPTQIVVLYHGGPDFSHVVSLAVTAAGTPAASGVLATTVGSTYVISGATASDTVTVTAKWDDGSSSVILMQTL